MSWLWLLLAGCPPEPTIPDSDGDGIPDAEDCAPEDADVFEGAPDYCDGKDNDCDDQVDEDAEFGVYYRDQDGDGYGDPTQHEETCDPPEGWLTNDDDCGAADPTIYPGAPEFCDGKDHDCDGGVNDDDARDQSRWYPDTDGDGFGDPSVPPISACEGPLGYVGNANDCDDGNTAISPNAPEVCDPLDVDENCNLLADTLDRWAAGGMHVFPDLDGDGYGDDDAEPIWVCDIPLSYTTNDLDCDDGRDRVNPDGVEVCNGIDDDCDGDADGGAADAPTWYLDRDEDGYGDEAVSQFSCEQPTGYAAYGTDCDDRNNRFHPGADEGACPAEDLNCDGFTGPTDNDGDGFTACDDCDDGDPLTLPGAEELCDGWDNDCDGVIDSDAAAAAMWYPDRDLDGYGDPAAPVAACDPPYLHVADSADCDDGDAAVHPDQPEDCATAGDDDCDGMADEANALGCTDWYEDADGDGWGVQSVCTCDAPAGWGATVGEDCDDADPAINPLAAEYCSTVDLDCDGDLSPCDISIAVGTVNGASSGDSVGRGFAWADMSGDGSGDLIAAGPDATGSATRSGNVYVMDGLPAGNVSASRAFLLLLGEDSGDDVGGSITAADSDQSGGAELVAGALGSNKAGFNGGIVYLWPGPDSGIYPLTAPILGLVGEGAGDEAGSQVAYLGDVDSDVEGEYAAGARRADRGGTERGAIYVFDINVAGSTGPLINIAAAGIIFDAEADGDRMGYVAHEAGDVNGDGINDLVAGAPGVDGATADTGAAYVFYGPFNATVSAANADVRWIGPATDSEAGLALSGLGDVDLDGLPDIAVSAPGADTVYLLTAADLADTALTDATARFTGAATDRFGAATDGADIDGSGAADLLIGAPEATYTASNQGVLYLYLDPAPGTHTAADASLLIPGEDRDDQLGGSLLGLPDTDGAGQADFLVGAPFHTRGGTQGGTVYYVLGEDLF